MSGPWIAGRERLHDRLAAYCATRHRLTTFIGTANEILWETTTDGVITYVGPRAEVVLGYAPDELLGQGLDIVLAGAFVAFGKEVDASIIADGVETAHELRAARALGLHAAQGFHTGRPAPADRMWGHS